MPPGQTCWLSTAERGRLPLYSKASCDQEVAATQQPHPEVTASQQPCHVTTASLQWPGCSNTGPWKPDAPPSCQQHCYTQPTASQRSFQSTRGGPMMITPANLGPHLDPREARIGGGGMMRQVQRSVARQSWWWSRIQPMQGEGERGPGRVSQQPQPQQPRQRKYRQPSRQPRQPLEPPAEAADTFTSASYQQRPTHSIGDTRQQFPEPPKPQWTFLVQHLRFCPTATFVTT